MLHGDIPTVEALASVVDSVTAVRSPEAPQHPLNRLGQERYLRWRLQQDPTLVGMATVEPAQPPIARPNLKDPVPCVATATSHDGSVSTLVCSVGVDVDLVGFVADVQAVSASPGGRRGPATRSRARSPPTCWRCCANRSRCTPSTPHRLPPDHRPAGRQ